MITCDYGHLEMVSYLISKGVNLDAKDLLVHLNHLNPLVSAYLGNHNEIVKLLRIAGADPKILEDYISIPKHRQSNCTLM